MKPFPPEPFLQSGLKKTLLSCLPLSLLKCSLGVASAAGWHQEEMKLQRRSKGNFGLSVTVWGHRQALWGALWSTGGLAPWCPVAAPEGNGATAHVPLTALSPHGGLHIPNQIHYLNGFWWGNSLVSKQKTEGKVMTVGVCFQMLIYLTTIKIKSWVIKWKQNQKGSVFPLHPYALEHSERAFVASSSFKHICGLKHISVAVSRGWGDSLTFPRVPPGADWGRPKPLPSPSCHRWQWAALGSGVLAVRVALGISNDNPSSLWWREEGKRKIWRLCDCLIPEYTFFFLYKTAADIFISVLVTRNLDLVTDAALKRIESWGMLQLFFRASDLDLIPPVSSEKNHLCIRT